MITTSEIKISVLVVAEQALEALRTVHRAFQLDKAPAGASEAPHESRSHARAGDATAVVARLQGMEDLTIDDITLDDSQARVTISGVPDTPGRWRPRSSSEIAAGGILRRHDRAKLRPRRHANLSFTVPQDEARKGRAAVESPGGQRWAAARSTSCPRVAKLSVSGIGMRSHTGVAIRMFRALAEAGINVEMINTSEVRVNVVVDGAAGPKALEFLQRTFADAQR